MLVSEFLIILLILYLARVNDPMQIRFHEFRNDVDVIELRFAFWWPGDIKQSYDVLMLEEFSL
jgi:hypothetical protein